MKSQSELMMDNSASLKGTVIDWDVEHCFGFIRSDDGSGIHFVHASDLAGRNSLPLGQRVQFTPVQLNAKNVILLD
jgi:cold shock CspA family protein